MTRSSIKTTRLLAALTAALLSCAVHAQSAPAAAQARPASGEQIATVNGVGLAKAELERRVRQQEAIGAAKDSPELRARLRDEMVAEELLFQEAVRQNIDQSPGFVQAMENARRSALATVLLQSVKPAAVTDAQIREIYDRSAKDLATNDVRLRAIVVDTQDKARAVRSALAKGGDFAELAQKNSQIPSARAGGELGWVNLRNPGKEAGGPLPVEVSAEVRKLSKGGFTPPTADARGVWWMVKLEDTRPSQVVPFEQVKDTLRRGLEANARGEAARKLLTDLRANAAVKLEP